jgi:hypothetical protein
VRETDLLTLRAPFVRLHELRDHHGDADRANPFVMELQQSTQMFVGFVIKLQRPSGPFQGDIGHAPRPPWDRTTNAPCYSQEIHRARTPHLAPIVRIADLQTPEMPTGQLTPVPPIPQ